MTYNVPRLSKRSQLHLQVQRVLLGADVRGPRGHDGSDLLLHEHRPLGQPLHRRVDGATAERTQGEAKGAVSPCLFLLPCFVVEPTSVV